MIYKIQLISIKKSEENRASTLLEQSHVIYKENTSVSFSIDLFNLVSYLLNLIFKFACQLECFGIRCLSKHLSSLFMGDG